MSYRVGVAGHRGYSGAELLRLLSRHPFVETILLDHREADGDAARFLREPAVERIPAKGEAVADAKLDIVFLATPHDVSIQLAPAFLKANARVVDLSGAFRLRTGEAHQRWYGETHAELALLAEAQYGLPEFYREQIPHARLIANPGCYPTAANLAIRPLVRAGLINRDAGIVCDAKSGVSGAGRKASLKTSFVEVTGNFTAYAILGHRHVPEVLAHSGIAESELSFSAQLIPVERGILETIYFRTSLGRTAAELLGIFERAYAEEPLVRVHAPGSTPDLRGVAYTNFCDLGVTFDEASGRGVVVSAIDNLGKGAAGQAIQNMNLLLGLPETEGLL